jgi:cytosine/adenosine deaminase-related metal-dependent hydrolase
MIDRKLTISLGTDSATAGRFLDMVRAKEIDSIEVGKRADVVIVGMDDLCWHANLDPERVILTVDERKVTSDVITAGKAWIGRAGMSLEIPWPVI